MFLNIVLLFCFLFPAKQAPAPLSGISAERERNAAAPFHKGIPLCRPPFARQRKRQTALFRSVGTQDRPRLFFTPSKRFPVFATDALFFFAVFLRGRQTLRFAPIPRRTKGRESLIRRVSRFIERLFSYPFKKPFFF